MNTQIIIWATIGILSLFFSYVAYLINIKTNELNARINLFNSLQVSLDYKNQNTYLDEMFNLVLSEYFKENIVILTLFQENTISNENLISISLTISSILKDKVDGDKLNLTNDYELTNFLNNYTTYKLLNF